MSRRILTLSLEGVGFKSSIQIRRGTTKLPIRKFVRDGLSLKNAQPAHCYVTRDLVSNRPVIVCYADGKDIEGLEETGDGD
jgi:hypothetical protein